jgi:hypothetical protein
LTWILLPVGLLLLALIGYWSVWDTKRQYREHDRAMRELYRQYGYDMPEPNESGKPN